MEQDTALAPVSQAQVIGVKSWLAYAGVALMAALLLFVLLPLAYQWNQIAAAVVLVVSALVIAYRFLMVRSVQLYHDDIGVWVHSGVLPWQKGTFGVKWRDMDEAVFINGFWSWATRSYTVRVAHRFTKDSEIVQTNIANGKDVVTALNAKHQDMIRSGLIR